MRTVIALERGSPRPVGRRARHTRPAPSGAIIPIRPPGRAGLAPGRIGRRVLVCDDSPAIRLLIRLLLEGEQSIVFEATDGRQGIDMARRKRPDVLIIDLDMPKTDGYEAIAQVRRDPALGAMAIVVLTSENGPGVERRVLGLGADDYLTKPFEVDVLLAKLRAAFPRSCTAAA